MEWIFNSLNKMSTFVVLCILALSIFIVGHFHNTSKIDAVQLQGSNATTKVSVEKVNENTDLVHEDIDLSSKPDVIPKDRGKLIYSPIGDSLSAGYFAETSEAKFTSVLSKGLESHLGYQVEELGVASYGGVLTGGLIALPELVKNNPDLISIEFGTNDCNEENNVPIKEFEDNLNKLIDGVTIEVNESPLVVLVTTWNQGSKCQPFDDVIKSVGEDRDIPVADISDIWKDPKSKGPAGIETYRGTSDTFHPNNYGMKKIAERIFTVIEPELTQ